MNTKKQGFFLIDVVVALSIFLILSVTIFSFLIISNNYFKASKESMKNSQIIEAVGKELKYNLDISKCKETVYINKSNLSMDKLKDNNINLLINNAHDGNIPYIEIDICESDFYEIKYLWINEGEQIVGEVYRKK